MRHRVFTVAATAALAVSLFATTAHAQDEGRLTLTTERVVVFKDGYAMVVKRAVGTSNAAGEVFTEEVPDAAVLGSFWATPEEGRLVAMTAGVLDTESESTEERDCGQYLELLVVNDGKQATVELDDGTSLSGTIRRVLSQTHVQPVPATAPAWLSGRAAPPAAVRRETTVLTGSLFVLGTEGGDVVLPVARVRKLTIPDMSTSITQTTRETRSRKRLTFRFDGGVGQRTLRIVYFRPGVRWIPTYRVDLASGAAASPRAKIRLQAEILNEAEDLVDVPFDLVVGVPNFRFREVVSPFVLESALRDALRQAAPQLMGQAFSNAGFASRSGEWQSRPGASSGGSIALPEEITAGHSQDLFVYSLPRLTLKKGERAAVPVFEANVAYRDVYTWDLSLSRRDIEAAPSGKGASPLTLSTNRIWHQVELENGTDVPWTTGAALLLDGHQPLAQELLTYTSPGGTVRVPVTVAVDLRGEYSEEETARDLDALQFEHHKYARIDKKGVLSITSRAQRAVTLEITCRLGGRADTASHDGRITLGAFESADWINYIGHPAVNNHSVVSFALRLAPGEIAAPEISYHYFARR